MENRITTIQIALELIARIYLVNFKGAISNRKFNSLDTKNRIGATCSIMEIPLDEPEVYIKRNTGKFSDPIFFWGM